MSQNNFPKLHNATWPGIVGKGPDSEPVISFDEMLKHTAAAEVGGVKFDGIDIGLFDPHIDLDKEVGRKSPKTQPEYWQSGGSYMGRTCYGQ